LKSLLKLKSKEQKNKQSNTKKVRYDGKNEKLINIGLKGMKRNDRLVPLKWNKSKMLLILPWSIGLMKKT